MGSDAANFVGDIPKYYDSGLGPNLFHHYGADISERVKHTNPAAVLELAAGTGIVSRYLRNILENRVTITSTDLNLPMLDVAAMKFESNENIKFQMADAMSLPFEDAMFDTVVCQFGVMFFPDKEQSYREVHRVLRPNGSYIFNVWASREKNPFAQLVHETVAAFFQSNPPKFYEVPFGYNDTHVIMSSLKRAGFSSVLAEHIPHVAHVHNIADFAKSLVYGNPICEEIRGIGGDLDEVVSSIEDSLKSKIGHISNNNVGTIPLEAIVFTAEF
jgi:ubiquinone/menaquinone biosynthesis C-methylase UbiE